MSDLVPRGTRIRLVGSMVLHVVGTAVARVSNSELDAIAQGMRLRGYTDIARNSSFSEVTLDATLGVDKPNLEAVIADFYVSADAGVFNCWPSNIRHQVLYHPRDHGGRPAPPQQLDMPAPTQNPLADLFDPNGGWLLPLLLAGAVAYALTRR